MKSYQIAIGPRKSHSTQHKHCWIFSICLKTVKIPLTKGGFVPSTFINLQKCLWHNGPQFINYQVRSTWFSRRCTFFMKNCLTKRQQRVRINSFFSFSLTTQIWSIYHLPVQSHWRRFGIFIVKCRSQYMQITNWKSLYMFVLI